MSLAGARGIFAPKRREPGAGDGTMVLVDHLREPRARLLKVALVPVAGVVPAWWFSDSLFALWLADRVITKPRAGGDHP